METLSVFRRARHSHLRVKKACSSNREALPRLLGRLLPRRGNRTQPGVLTLGWSCSKMRPEVAPENCHQGLLAHQLDISRQSGVTFPPSSHIPGTMADKQGTSFHNT
jgi:hypothetical protein